MSNLNQKFSVDDIVWVNLGKTYGWWPAQVQDNKKLAKLSRNILKDLGEDFLETTENDYDEKSVCVKFFDDDNKEWYRIKEEKRIQMYSCKDKLKFIRNGFKNLDETKKKGLGGVNLKLAQFYKDVELAEVLTDNNPVVGDILAQYEVAENNDDNENVEESQIVESTESSTTSKPAPKSKSKSQKKSRKKDPLREIKDGNIKKSGTKRKETSNIKRTRK